MLASISPCKEEQDQRPTAGEDVLALILDQDRLRQLHACPSGRCHLNNEKATSIANFRKILQINPDDDGAQTALVTIADVTKLVNKILGKE